ncbi:MAG TPA: OB-fold domain-containing protein [Acidimicrobiales bacterium]|nr:OB-fold domain-containing protein [Acidimicrobiales bacterium]
MAPYWAAAHDHRLVVQRCTACGSFRWPPLPSCPECLASTAEWLDSSLTGVIWSYVVYRRAFHPGFRDDLPYVVAIVELESGLRVEGAVLGPPDAVAIGLLVEAVFDDVTPDVTLVKWQLAPPFGSG